MTLHSHLIDPVVAVGVGIVDIAGTAVVAADTVEMEADIAAARVAVGSSFAEMTHSYWAAKGCRHMSLQRCIPVM